MTIGEKNIWGFEEPDDTFTFDDCSGLCDWTLYCQRNISGTNDPDECAEICQENVDSQDPVWECWIGCGSEEKGCDELVECLGDCKRNNP